MRTPVSLYVHVPFCKSKCRYCDFYSVQYTPEKADAYIEALAREWNTVFSDPCWHDAEISTIFFGGGTPSLLSAAQWKQIGKHLLQKIPFAANTEISVECNPDSISPGIAGTLLDLGVNRLTLGVQSLDSRELKLLGRIHTPGRVREIVAMPFIDEFKSVGVDLMLGIPGQTAESLQVSLNELFGISPIKHFSVYELTINATTPFGRHQRLLPLPPDDSVAEMAETVASMAARNGFEHYEVSNFALPTFRCRHNEAYWDHRPYIGLGPGAHSYWQSRRRANFSDVDVYIEYLAHGTLPTEFTEEIGSCELAREMIFLGLRRSDGLDEEQFRLKTNQDFCTPARHAALGRYLDNGFLVYKRPWWRPTRKGMLFADAISRELI